MKQLLISNSKRQGVKIEMPDGFLIAANCVTPANAKAVILICAGAATPQYCYFNLASHLAKSGYAIVSYDHRGIAASAGNNIKKVDAGIQQVASDFCQMIDWVDGQFPALPLYVLAHSLGGTLPAIVQNNYKIDAIFTVGTQLGYYKDWGYSIWKNKKMYFQWHVLLPAVTKLFGYFPGKLLGMGQNIPSSLITDLHQRKKFNCIFEHLGHLGIKTWHKQLHCPIMALAMSDDALCTPQAMNRYFDLLENAVVQKNIICTKSLGGIKVGHSAFFSHKNGPKLWANVNQWFDAVYESYNKAIG